MLMESRVKIFVVHKTIARAVLHNKRCNILLNNWTRWRLDLKLEKHTCNTSFAVTLQKCSVDNKTSRDYQSEIRGDVLHVLAEFILESLIT